MYEGSIPLKANQATGPAYAGEAAMWQIDPLSVEVINRTMEATDTAQRVHSRLYDLRDRLLGSPPPSPCDPGAKPSPASFSDTYRDRARTLQNILHEVETLASELASRL